MSFDRTQVSDMGLKFSGLFRAPFLNTGVLYAADHWDGKYPVLNDCLYRFVTTGASSSASSFRSLHGIWSGPAVFLGFSVASSLCTSASYIANSFMGG